jgi:hypothetical protein
LANKRQQKVFIRNEIRKPINYRIRNTDSDTEIEFCLWEDYIINNEKYQKKKYCALHFSTIETGSFLGYLLDEEFVNVNICGT